MLRRALTLLVALGLLLGLGCGGGLAQVEGTITLDGKPLAEASISLSPKGKAAGDKMATGRSDQSGHFTLSTGPKHLAGAYPGEYTVSVTKSPSGPSMPAGLTPGSPEYMKYMAEQMKKGGTTQQSPEALALAKANKKGLTVTIVSGQPLQIDLVSK